MRILNRGYEKGNGGFENGRALWRRITADKYDAQRGESRTNKIKQQYGATLWTNLMKGWDVRFIVKWSYHFFWKQKQCTNSCLCGSSGYLQFKSFYKILLGKEAWNFVTCLPYNYMWVPRAPHRTFSFLQQPRSRRMY